MVAHPPSPALDSKAPHSPNAGWNAIVTRSTNPAKRAVDVTCVVLIQLLILMILGDEKYRDTCRDCYVLAPDSVLNRLEQGDDFGLPGPLVASLRLAVRLIRAEYNLGQDYIDWLTAAEAPAPAQPPRRQRHPSETRRHVPALRARRAAARHAPIPLRRPAPWPPPAIGKNPAPLAPVYARPNCSGYVTLAPPYSKTASNQGRTAKPPRL